MHHVSRNNISSCGNISPGDCSGDNEDAPNETAIDPDEGHHSLDNHDSLLDQLPETGYRIFDQRPSISEPLALPTCDLAHGYISFTPPMIGETAAERLQNLVVSTASYIAINWSRLLLVFVPAGILSPHVGCSDTAVFILNCLAVIPLADVLCRATDDLSSFLGETTGALVNVTMGNATEMVIFHALISRQYMIVRTSLLGSIVVNNLLVLGLAILAGESQERSQFYNVLATRVAAGLLCLTTVSLLVPSTIKTSDDEAELARDILALSRTISIVLIVVYLIYLWTQLKSTKYSYKPLIQLDDPVDAPEMDEVVELHRPTYHRRTVSYPRTPPTTPPTNPPVDLEAQRMLRADYTDSLPDPSLASSWATKVDTAIELLKSVSWVRKSMPIALLILSTGLISVCGDYLVNSIDHFVAHSPVSKTMVGLIILPIVGNAAELVSGIMFASRRQMDLAFAVAIGSAIQIALFVTPLIVLVGWAMNREMSLHFTGFESVTLTASSVLFLSLVFDEKGSYVKGTCLCAGYIIIGLASYFQ
ncbi:hypothetical protein BS50DRAFT_58526 [Corynespora cassiicola Philippines]|uniref:Sodium/calcium exchanger membrane region domain-containing protein n=1 Tax=Corynespora cassiicola Philippines TaxID=1448308 RepID=A0A2T2NK71_CORCC|nr:hypothetical protein BS50DRAFT_58526 [Corynespora cassiicola Philippines]